MMRFAMFAPQKGTRYFHHDDHTSEVSTKKSIPYIKLKVKNFRSLTLVHKFTPYLYQLIKKALSLGLPVIFARLPTYPAVVLHAFAFGSVLPTTGLSISASPSDTTAR